jgi:hexosaminidase
MIRCLLALLSLIAVVPVAAAAQLGLIPAPASITMSEGWFELRPSTRILAKDAQGQPIAEYARQLLQEFGASGKAASGSRARDAILLELQPKPDANPESYELNVSRERVLITASDARGLRYGVVTLWQLFSGAASVRIPALTIRDQPRLGWRGLLLDSARHYQSVQFIERFIDQMALHKLNVLHWHLTDDQAWRLEIKQYPQLTAVGAWRVPAGAAPQRRYGGFYTQDQVRGIVAHAARRGITVVPEIEMPGHASAAIAAYPQLGVDGRTLPAVPADWGVYTNLFNVEEATFAFLQNVLDEVMGLFPSEYIHVGGDEAVKDQWRASAAVQRRMRELGLADEHALQSYFIQRMGRFLEQRGRRLIGWDEILEGGLAKNATVMSWRGLDGAIAAAAAGHDTVLTPAPTLYLDNRNSDAPDEPPGRGRVVSLRDVYTFDPAPASIANAQQHVIGVQANIWTEHIRTEERVEHMAFPRAAALAEVGWTPAAGLNWEDFSARLPVQMRRYARAGVRHASVDGITQSVLQPRSAVARTSQELRLCTEKLVLNLEDDAPLDGKRAVFLVDIMNPCWIYSAADLSDIGAIAAAVGQVPFNFQIGDDVKKIPLRKPQSAAGELEVRIDGCAGEKIATLPLAPAVKSYAVTELPPVPIARRTGAHDLCFTFTQATVDPLWVVDALQLVGLADVAGGAHPATVAVNR